MKISRAFCWAHVPVTRFSTNELNNNRTAIIKFAPAGSAAPDVGINKLFGK